MNNVTQNLNVVHDETMRPGDRIADAVASIMGSWKFIITQSILLFLWITLNTIAFIAHWDAYPYILLNLALSFQAAFATPIILMSQNRQSTKDRLMAEHDYTINLKSEEESRQLIEHLADQDTQLLLSNEKQDRQIELLQLGNAELLKQTTMLVQLLEKISQTTVSDIADKAKSQQSL